MLKQKSKAETKFNTRKRAKTGAQRARLDQAKTKHRHRDFRLGDFVRPGAVGRRPRSRV